MHTNGTLGRLYMYCYELSFYRGNNCMVHCASIFYTLTFYGPESVVFCHTIKYGQARTYIGSKGTIMYTQMDVMLFSRIFFLRFFLLL